MRSNSRAVFRNWRQEYPTIPITRIWDTALFQTHYENFFNRFKKGKIILDMLKLDLLNVNTWELVIKNEWVFCDWRDSSRLEASSVFARRLQANSQWKCGDKKVRWNIKYIFISNFPFLARETSSNSALEKSSFPYLW